MYTVSACFVCSGTERTEISPYNGLIALDEMRSNELSRVCYELCHQCGLVYATRRPAGAEYDFLYRHFNEFLGRDYKKNIFDDTEVLTPQLKAELDKNYIPWWELGPHVKDEKYHWVNRSMYSDFVSQTYNLDIIKQHVSVEGKRVLEFRSKTGYIADYLKREGKAAEACTVPMFPIQEYTIQQVYGLPTRSQLNFENFVVPYEGTFDLIISRHLFTHSLDPTHLFQTLYDSINPNGYLFICEENDDAALFNRAKNLFGELKAFHFQNFDIPVLDRTLRRFGFTPIVLQHKREGKSPLVCLAQRTAPQPVIPLTPQELENRLNMYGQWYDESVFMLPKGPKKLFKIELPEVQERLLRHEHAEVRPNGKIKLKRRIRYINEDGFSVLNKAFQDGQAQKQRLLPKRAWSALMQFISRQPLLKGLNRNSK